jgi:hypothetical protein
MKLNTEFLKKENFSINLQNPEERKEFENLIRTFIFNQVMNTSYSYIKNKKCELSIEKYSKLVEFIKKHCINKQIPIEFDFYSEITNKYSKIELETQQNEFVCHQKINSFNDQINNNQNFFNHKASNANNYLDLQNLNNLYPQITHPVIPQLNDLSNLANIASQNMQNIPTIHCLINKIENIPLIHNFNNNLIMYQSLHCNYNYLNSLLGNKTLRSNSFVNNFDNYCNPINQEDNQLGTYNLIMYQNNIINNLLVMFPNLRTSMGNNVPNNFYHF